MIIIILKKQAHNNEVIVSIILMWLPYCLKRIIGSSEVPHCVGSSEVPHCVGSSEVPHCVVASVSSDNLEENSCQRCSIKDTLPYLELRPGSPTVSIQKLPVIVGACHCFREMVFMPCSQIYSQRQQI